MENVELAITTRIQQRFAELRDELLAAAQEFAKSENHDWGHAERLFSASKKVDELCRCVMTPATDDATDQISVFPATVDGAHTLRSGDRKSPKKSKKDYPQYTVRSDALIKLGLSRNRRDVYEHTVPRVEFDAVIQRLGKLAGRRHFSADDVIDKVPLPSYQVYIVISVLRDRGLLAVPRRGMYAFTRPKNFLREVRALWDSLERHQTENADE